MRVLVYHAGKQWGPFTLDELQRAVTEKRFTPGDLAWHEGLPQWVPLDSLLRTSQSEEARYRDAIPTSGLAVASLALGVSSTFSCIIAGLPAIVCGHLARAEIRRSGGKLNGDGFAVAGLVLGYASLAMLLLFALIFLLVAVGVSVPLVAMEKKPVVIEQRSQNAAKQVYIACKAFAADNGGRFPETLEDLVPFYLPDRQSLACPLAPREEVGYYYFGGTDSKNSSEPLFVSKGLDQQGMQIVVRKDGSITTVHPSYVPGRTTARASLEIAGEAVRSGSAR